MMLFARGVPRCPRTRPPYAPEFRQQMVDLVRAGRDPQDLARGFEAQNRELKAVGAEKLFAEQVSSVAARPQLEAALDFVREGDVFVVTEARPARSDRSRNMLEIVARLDRKSVALRIINLGLDTSTPTGKLMLTVMGGRR